MDSLEALIEPQKPRRAGGIVAAVAAVALVGGALFFALRPSVEQKTEATPVAFPIPEQARDGKSATGEATGNSEPTEHAAAPSAGAADQAPSKASDAKLSGAFAVAMKENEKDVKAAAADESQKEAKAQALAAKEKDSEAEPLKREAAPVPAPEKRSGVAHISLRTVPDDADIYNHRGKRVGIGTAQAEVEPKAKYTYTILRHGYKPRKVTLDGSETEIVIELERAFPKN